MSTGVKNPKPAADQQAQWNVQVVRGKVTTRCLWNACKALSVGLLLLTIGTSMAVVGYYADQLSIRSETRGNSTIKIKNESRGFHLNNLSYAGPIVMGVGGFIVVAACVMTFEARDSAAKVVPARFKPSLNLSSHRASTKSSYPSKSFQRMESKRNTSSQTGGNRSLGVHKMDSLKTRHEWSPKNDPCGRKALTSAFVQFSRELLENSSFEENRRWKRKTREANLNKSPSAPDLVTEDVSLLPPNSEILGNISRRFLSSTSPNTANRSPQREVTGHLATVSGNLYLRPNHLQRQALSMDNPLDGNYGCFTPPSTRLSRQHSRTGESKESLEMELGCNAGVSGSQTSMALDLHDCQVTLKVKDESARKRSDTSRRHQLLRQKPVEDDKEDRFPRCSCIPMFLLPPKAEDWSIKTKSSLNLKTTCHYCSQFAGRSHIPKITADLRSQSFSQCPEMRRSGFREEEDAKIFCVEDHRRALNFSSENIKICCEDKLEYLKRHSSSISPHRSPRKHECRIQRQDGIECLVHRAKDIRKNCPLIRSNARRRKCSQKIEGSLSAEEQNLSRGILKDRTVDSATTRSASFSPTANLFKSSFSFQHDSSIIHTSLAGRSTPSINDNGAQKVSNLELIGDVAEAQASTNKEKEEKIELEEPS